MKMREMKDSGIEWLGSIPIDWEYIKCKYISSFVNGYAFDSKDLCSNYVYPVIRIGDIKMGRIDFESCLGVNNNDGLKYYKIRNNDILLAMSGATVGKVGFSNTSKTSYINQRVGIIRTSVPKFLFYSLYTNQFIEYIMLMSNGSAQPNVSGTMYGNYYITYPTTNIQNVIADFLDRKCSEIDSLVSDIQRQIEILEEYRRSVITEAVTKGLDKNAPLKDSGIEWIGDIPDKWIVIKFKYTHNGSNVGEAIDKEYWSNDNNETVFYTAGIRPIHSTYKQFPTWKYTNTDDILLARNGTPYVYFPFINAIYTDHIIRVSVNIKYDKKYIGYCLQQSILSEVVDTVSIATWSVSLWDKQYLPIPPLPEQQKIADYLDRKCAEIDNVISEKKQQLETLEEYKKSLIFEYVTGKKEVHDYDKETNE